MKIEKTSISLVILTLVFALICIPAQSLLAQEKGGTLGYPITSEPQGLDPQHWYNTKNANVVGQHIYESLIAVDKDYNFVPSLATSWELAKDQKSCVFHLRKGVKFHDGAPFDAKAVAANYDRLVNKRPNAWKIVKGWFKSTEIIDEYTIRINLTKPYAPFFTELVQAYCRIISPAAIEKYGMDLGLHPSGTGPWKFVEWMPGEKIVCAKNPHYWQGEPHLDRVEFIITADATSRMMGFESGSFDIIYQPQYIDIERMEKSGKYESYSQQGSELFHFIFSCLLEPFNQKQVRQAIAYAINKKQIVKSLLGGKVVVANGFGPIYLSDTLIKEAYPYDPAKAKEILKGLGWKPGKDGILVKNGKRFETKLMTPHGRYPMDRQISEALQSNLKEIGIDAKVEVVEAGAFIKWVNSPPSAKERSPIGLCARTRPLGGSLEFALVQHYHTDRFSPAGSNAGFYSNKDLDEYLIRASGIVDDEERKEVYRKAQELLFEDCPAIPIYYYRSYMFYWPYVHNIALFTPFATPTPYVSHKTWMDK